MWTCRSSAVLPAFLSSSPRLRREDGDIKVVADNTAASWGCGAITGRRVASLVGRPGRSWFRTPAAGRLVMRRSATCGSRRARSRLEDAEHGAAAGAGDHRGAFEVHCRAHDPTRKTEDLLLGSQELIRALGRVPRRLIWDNETEISRRERLRRRGGRVHRDAGDPSSFSCGPGIRSRRGSLSGVTGFETPSMPGRAFASPTDFNAQFTDWLERANSRVVRTLRASPADRVEADRAAMLPLPAVPPQLGWCHQIRLGRDYYRPARCQRLLCRSGRDRPPGRRDSRPGPGAGPRWRAPGRRPRPGLGPRGSPRPTPTMPRRPGGSGRSSANHAAPRLPVMLLRDLADYDRAFGLITADGEVA